MDTNFSDFLSRMGNETTPGRRRQPEPAPRPVVEEKRQPPKKKREEEERPRQSRREEFPEPEEEFVEEKREPKSVINEEFMDKAYDYAHGVIKVVRNNFKTTEEKVAMLESLQKAISSYLHNIGVGPITYQQNNYSPQSTPPAKMSEQEWNNMPTVQTEQFQQGHLKMNNLTGQEFRAAPPSNGAYNPRLNIGIKVTSDGKQEADLSGVTAMDINEMKMLAGLVGPEAERKKQESLALPTRPAALSQEAQEEAAKALRES